MHPIVAQMRASDEQRPAVLERGRDIVVTAGAGTGKTRTLVARYLSLLAEGQDLRSVLAITFTRKAAREMRNRVRDEIRRYLQREDLDVREQQVWQDRYAALDAARIGTIHSLCTELLRAHPAEAGVDPRFEVLEEGRANTILSRAAEEAMGWAADEASVVGLYALLGEWRLRSILESLLQKRLEVEHAFAGLPEQILLHWQQTLREQQEHCLVALLHSEEWLDAVSVLHECEASEPDDRMELQRQQALAALQIEVESLGEQLDLLSQLGAIDLRGGSKNNWPGGRGQLDEAKAALRTLRDLWRGQSPLLELSLGSQDEVLAQVLPALGQLFDRAVAVYEQLKDERQALDFDDLESRALGLLQTNPEVRARWRREIRAILVDEFQDTNARQRDLVKLLNDGTRLFIVGDAKQSIYRFRGADVAVFRQERERIIEEGGRFLPLETTYRAHTELVEGLNDLLRPVLGVEDDPDRPWVEPFARLRPYRPRAGAGFVSPHIELHLTVGTKGAGSLERAADALAGRIIELVEGGLQVPGGDRNRPPNYDDFAVLCRASTSFAAYEDALERAGVPFLTVSGRGFHDRPEIRDLLNALKALADPTDDLALVGLLRSPSLAVSDAVLYRLCRERDKMPASGTIWDLLRTGPGTLSGDDGVRVGRAVRIIGLLHRQVGRTGVVDLVKGFLDATGYRAALIQAGQIRAARNVSKLLADAHASGIVGVGEFLEYLAGLRSAGAREGEARATTEGAVQIMSIHAAKGLEFPVVIIGDVTGGGGRSSPLLIDPELGPLLKLEDEDGSSPAIYHLGKLRSDDQEAAESDRLLYVAATRAREKLILSGCLRLNRANVVASVGGYLGRLAGANCLGLYGLTISHEEEGAAARQISLQVGATPVACVVYEPGHVRDATASIPKEAVEGGSPGPPPLLEPVSVPTLKLDDRVAEQERIPPQRVWRVVPMVRRPRAPAWVVGSLVHEALAAWRFPGDRSAAGERHSFEHWAQARARGYGIADSQQLRDAVRRSRQFMLRFQGHPLHQEMDGADQRLHEVPFSLLVDGHVEIGIIDAVYERAGVWTIVEFKTDWVRNRAELERLLAEQEYLAQARRYMDAAQTLLGLEPRLFLCMLNYAGSVYPYQLSQVDDAPREAWSASCAAEGSTSEQG